MSHPPITHVIFDLDGTLLDTEPLYTQAAQAVVGRFGKTYDWSVKRLVVGGDPLVGAQLIVERLGLPLSAAAYLTEREALMHELCRDVAAMPGALALIETLVMRGIPFGIGTSGARAISEHKLSAHAFAAQVHCLVCSDDPGITQAKPAPDIFLAVARKLGADPSACLVLEDSPKGVQAARAAGMRAIAIVDPSMRGEDYDGALHVLDSLAQVNLDLLTA